jgi:hypothetical protein
MANLNPNELPNDTVMNKAKPGGNNKSNANHSSTEENPAEKVEEWTMLVKLIIRGNNVVDIITIHRDIISKMRSTDLTVSFTTSDGAVITSDEDFPTGYDYKKKFEMKETKFQFSVAHKVFSTLSLDAIKRGNLDLLDYLNTNNVYLDLLATGSINKVLLGPLFGIHLEDTHKKQLEKDISKLLSVHQTWDTALTNLHNEAKLAHPFETV